MRWPSLRSWRWRLPQPSLFRSITLGAWLLFAGLWALMLALGHYFSVNEVWGVDKGARREVLVLALETLPSDSARLAFLQAYDRQLLQDAFEPDEAHDRLKLLAHRSGQLFFASPGLARDLKPTEEGVLALLEVDGHRWRLLCSNSQTQPWSVCMVKSADSWKLLFGVGQKTRLIGPLVMVIPFLILPLALAFWLGLRPLRQLTEALKGLNEEAKAPMVLRRNYKELSPLVDAINAWTQLVSKGRERDREFIANAAHELRTPLAALRVNAEALAGFVLPAKAGVHMAHLLNSCRRMSRMVEQLMALLRNDFETSAFISPQTIRLRAMLQERLAELAILAASARVELQLEAEQEVLLLGRTEMLQSVVDNLVGNAIRYAPAGSVVRIGLSQCGDAACIEVRDQGPGMSAEFMSVAFERFTRAAGDGSIGAGLGLSIVKAAVRAHQGQVLLVRPSDGPGLLVRIFLPLSPSPPAPMP